jgi:hypothetical protein
LRGDGGLRLGHGGGVWLCDDWRRLLLRRSFGLNGIRRLGLGFLGFDVQGRFDLVAPLCVLDQRLLICGRLLGGICRLRLLR